MELSQDTPVRWTFAVVNRHNSHEVPLIEANPLTLPLQHVDCAPRRSLLELLRECHQTWLNECFPGELEPFDIWKADLILEEDDDPDPRCTHSRATEGATAPPYFFCVAVALAVDPSRGEIEIVGLATVETYVNSRTSYLGFLAVKPSHRRLGIARALLDYLGTHLLPESHGAAPTSATRPPPCHGGIQPTQFLLCSKRCHEGADVVDPRARHRLYRDAGFVPLNFDYYDAGRLRAAYPSALAVHRPGWSSSTPTCYSKAAVHGFLKDMYEATLADEGKTLTTELEEFTEQFTHQDLLLGNEYW